MKYPLFFVVLAILTQSCTKEQQKSPVPQPELKQSQPASAVPTFDGKRAFEYLKAQTDLGPRNPGSTGHQKCLDYLQKELQKYADAVNAQPFTLAGYDGETLKLTNLIASFNLQSTTRILLIAHWDTRPRADQEKDPKKRNQPILGANDAASGVAIYLEIARQLRSAPPPIGVDILFVDGEDYGREGDTPKYLLGARYFAEHLPKGFSPAFGILLDMVGDKQLEIRKEQYSMKYAPDVVELVWSTAAELGIEQFSSFAQNAVIDDHIPLNEAGIKTIDLIDFNYPDESNRFWHTTEDTPDKCSPESLEAVGRVILKVIYTYKP